MAARAGGRPHPAVAAVRYAVRSMLADLSPGDLVTVALSGGADSLALADAVAFEAPRLRLRGGAVIVDHGLQEGSGAIASRAASTARDLGLDPVDVVSVAPGIGEPGGLEAAARAARYAALAAVADRTGAVAVLLGHTLDDQAEQVLLGLVRGSGARSLAGMSPVRGGYRRPLLGITRQQTRDACTAEGLTWWDDPMNDDPRFTRVRARRALADLERDLGPGLAAALARTAYRLRSDADHLDALADEALTAFPDGSVVPVDAMSRLPDAVRTRVWRRLLIARGAPAGSLSSTHIEACDALVTRWHGQGPVDVPGDVSVGRAARLLRIESPASG